MAECLASEPEILPFDEAEVVWSVEQVRDAWLNNLRDSDPALRGMLNVAQFVVDNSDLVADYTKPDGSEHFLLVYEACGGVTGKDLCTKLKELGLLHRQDKKGSRNLYRFVADSNKGKEEFYALLPVFLNYAERCHWVQRKLVGGLV